MVSHSKKAPLTDQVAVPDALPDIAGEDVWIDVIQKMETIYADLVESQVELEEKNSTLEQTYRQLHEAHEALKTTQQQLIQSEKMASLGRLVAGVAHEINNPISFILGNTHALQQYSERIQGFFSQLETINNPAIADLRQQRRMDQLLDDLDPLVEGTMEGAQRVSDIVESLLRFTMPQQRQAQPVELCALVRIAVEWVIRASRNKPQVHFDLPEALSVSGHEGLVHQILINLVHNAVDASEHLDAPELWISLTREQQRVVVTVRDNGTGIEPDHLGAIFDPFFTTKDAGKGTGLGLYISYLLATNQCAGELTAENHAAGGAVFRLALPLTLDAGLADA